MAKNKKRQERKEAIKRDYLAAFQLNERIFAGLEPEENPASYSAKESKNQILSNEWEEFDPLDNMF